MHSGNLATSCERFPKIGFENFAQRAISARESEWEPILSELRTAIREHALFLKGMIAEMSARESARVTSDSKAAD